MPPPPPADPDAVVDYTAPPQALRAEALALSFNPYAAYARAAASDAATGAVSPSISRLRLSDAAGGEVRVSNLSEGVTFTVAAPPVAADADPASRLPACVFWDPEALQFSGEGCAALPSPRPPGWTLRWLPGFRANSTRDLATRGWRAEPPPPPSHDPYGRPSPPAESCQVIFVNCAQYPLGALVWPYPQNPIAVPAVRCPAAPASNSSGNATAGAGAANGTATGASAAVAPPPLLNGTGGTASAAWGFSFNGSSSAASPYGNGSWAMPPPGTSDPSAAAASSLAPTLRVFVGCEIARRNNSLGCWWDVTTQAFTGPRCEFDSVQGCSCVHLTECAHSPPSAAC